MDGDKRAGRTDGARALRQDPPGYVPPHPAPAARAQPLPGHRLAWRVAVAAIGLVAALAYLVSGLLLVFALFLYPKPGMELLLIVLKGATAIGWLGIGGWLLADLARLRIRVIGAAIAAWAWVWTCLALTASAANTNWGP